MAGGLWALGVDTALRHSDQLPEKGYGGTRVPCGHVGCEEPHGYRHPSGARPLVSLDSSTVRPGSTPVPTLSAFTSLSPPSPSRSRGCRGVHTRLQGLTLLSPLSDPAHCPSITLTLSSPDGETSGQSGGGASKSCSQLILHSSLYPAWGTERHHKKASLP